MSWKDKIISLLHLEEKPAPFELLETEKGEPGFWGGWPYSKAESGSETENEGIPAGVEACEKRLRDEFYSDINTDAVMRRFKFCKRIDALCVYVTGMANSTAVNDFVMRDAMQKEMPEDVSDTVKYAEEYVFTLAEIKTEKSWRKCREAILNGKCAVFFEGSNTAVVLDTRGAEHRSISTPQNEQVIRGPQEGFTEHLRTNITLLRRIIRMPSFICETRDAGAENGLGIALLYRADIVNEELLAEVKRRFSTVDTDMVLNLGILKQLTEKHGFSVFPRVLSTERPDRTAGYIMQGHVAVMLEGSPFAAIIPANLFAFMASAEDATLRAPQGGFIRAVRFAGAMTAVLLPGYFIALSLYHQGLLPTEILITIVNSRKMVYASIGSEMLFLLLIFQLIREAGLRIPGNIGQTIGIMGGLLLGQAAISANLASSVILIVVAFSALGNFCIPDYEMQITASYLRMGFVIAAWLGGLLGMAGALMTLIAYTASLKSYGVPFLTPVAPKTYAKQPVIRRGLVTMHHKQTDYTNAKRKKA